LNSSQVSGQQSKIIACRNQEENQGRQSESLSDAKLEDDARRDDGSANSSDHASGPT
jgi:hypothetical protein